MRVSKLIVAILVALAVMPAAAAQAAVQVDRVSSGTVHLKLTDGMRKRLAKEGVRLVALNPARTSRSGLVFPISGGLLGSKAGKGHLDLDGGFKLVAGRRSVRVEHLILYTGIHAINGTIDGRRRIRVANFPAQQLTFDGFNRDLRLNRLKPGDQIAGLINHKLGIGRTFAAGRPLASGTAAIKFETLTIRSGEIILRVDPAFEDKLTSIEATIGSSGSAEPLGISPVVISMPLDGGQISPGGTGGNLLTQGGFGITQPEGSYEKSMAFLDMKFMLDVHTITGDANYYFFGLFAMIPFSGDAIQADPTSGEVSSLPIPVLLHARFVKVMNEIFAAAKGHPELFSADETLGTVAFRVQTR